MQKFRHQKASRPLLPPYVLPIAATASEDIIFLALGGLDNAYVVATDFEKFLDGLYAMS